MTRSITKRKEEVESELKVIDEKTIMKNLWMKAMMQVQKNRDLPSNNLRVEVVDTEVWNEEEQLEPLNEEAQEPLTPEQQEGIYLIFYPIPVLI